MVRNISETSYLKRNLEDNWTFKEAGKRDDFLPVSQFPTVIHLDLLHHDKIPDPTIDLNREACQWVGETKWLYHTTFSHAKSRVRPNLDLVFEGLDTFATVTLNGKEILQADNMFVEYRVPVADALVEGQNVLEILFDSAFLRGRELEEQQGFKNEFWNGDSSRLNVRKVGCHYGWDWGPRLMTAGPFKPIYLEEYDDRIEELDVDVEVLPGLDMAILSISTVTTKGSKVYVGISDPSGKVIVSVPVSAGQRPKVTIEAPALWFPVGYGKQPLYTAKAALLNHPSGQLIEQRFGIRLLEVVQQPLQPREVEGSEELVQSKGLSFFFRVNHVPIYCQGTDWIPGDTFLPRMTRDRYRHALVDDFLGSNQNMIRVWGGGQFESSQDFYDVCDEHGILVWQDMMMGCGAYPVNPHLLASIETEVRQNVKRMRHHPSIVLWCGNNEDYMFAEVHNLTYNPEDTDPVSWLKTNWPARYYYEKMFPEICAKYSPRIPYLPSSPFSPPSHDLPHRLANDTETGDTHAWRVWMADQPRLPYQQYASISGRFVSEFGMKSYPCLRTLEAHITKEADRHPQSRILDAWHMAPEDQRTLALYLNENFRCGGDLTSYVYATQLLQAEAMDFAVRAFRRGWRGLGHEECAGSLIWQLNDCYPAVSWSLVDADSRKKLAWYAVKRAYAPITINAERFVSETRDPGANKFSDVVITRTTGLRIWTSNLTTKPVAGTVHLRVFPVNEGESVYEEKFEVEMEPNRSQEVKTILPVPVPVPVQGSLLGEDATHEAREELLANSVVALTLYSEDGNQLARFINWPQPLRHLDLRPSRLAVTVSIREDLSLSPGQNVYSLTLRAKAPLKALELYAADADLELSDNCIDLVPDEEVEVIVRGLNPYEGHIRTRHLGDVGAGMSGKERWRILG